MYRPLIKEIARKHKLIHETQNDRHSDVVYAFAEELLRRVHYGQGSLHMVQLDLPMDMPPAHDPVNHPSHYTSHPSGVEAIEITRHMGFNLGNAMKYLWRNGLKDGQPAVQDLEKAVWYIQDEIKRLKSTQKENL